MGDKRSATPDILEVWEMALKAALREIRRARARAPSLKAASEVEPLKSTSNVSICIDILEKAGHPLHISVLVAALEKLKISTTRDSLVSALTKQLAPHGPFVRTDPNTFGLLRRDHPAEK